MRLSLLSVVRTGSFGFLLISALPDARANSHIGQTCEAQWQILKNSSQNKRQMDYAEFLVKCRIKAPRSTVLKEQSTNPKTRETMVSKSAPAIVPTAKISDAKKLKLQKQCLVEWKAAVFANNLKTHPSWRKFLRQCKQRLSSKFQN